MKNRLLVAIGVLCAAVVCLESKSSGQGFGQPLVDGFIFTVTPEHDSTVPPTTIEVGAESTVANLDLVDVQFTLFVTVYKQANGQWVQWKSLEPYSDIFAPGDTGILGSYEHLTDHQGLHYKVEVRLVASHSFEGGQTLGPPFEVDEHTYRYFVDWL